MKAGMICREIYRTYIVEMPNNFAAALSYYSLFSLVPTLYIALLVARIFIDDTAVMQVLFARVTSVMGVEVAELLQDALQVIAEDGSQRATVDLVVSSSALLLSASLVFFKLQYALNTIWKIPPAAKGQTKAFLVNRLISFAMVLCVGILILVVSLSNFLISFFGSLLQLQLDVPYLNVGTNWVIYAAAIALTFRFLPDARISWRVAFVGAGVTALLLLTGTTMLGWYLARSNVGSAFEAAGTMAVLLIGIYFLAQCFIFGAVLTRVFAEFYGGGIHLRNAAASQVAVNVTPATDDRLSHQGHRGKT